MSGAPGLSLGRCAVGHRHRAATARPWLGRSSRWLDGGWPRGGIKMVSPRRGRRRAADDARWASGGAARAAAAGTEAVRESAYGIEAEEIYVRYGESGAPGSKDALNGVTVRVPRGTLFMLLGPNGCGKSTLLRAMAGLVRPWSGRLRVQAPRAFVFQNPDHQVIMPTVGADVAFSLGHRADLSDAEVAEMSRRALDAVNLGGDDMFQRQVATLSGGQKQRVAIAGALVESPNVLLLDELTTFLDEADQAGVVRAVRKVVTEENVTAVWVTHRLEELRHADMAAYMEDGRVVQVGTGEAIGAHVREQQRLYMARGRRRG